MPLAVRLLISGRLLLLFAPLVGCHTASDAEIAAHRQRFLLAAEPDGGETVLDVRETYTKPCEVTIVGRIGGVSQPWSKGKASFVVVDPSVAAIMESEEHDCGDNCPYCKKKQKENADGLALIEFTDEDGTLLPVDARKLFDLAENQTVVVRGAARVDKTGSLIVRGNGIYIRR